MPTVKLLCSTQTAASAEVSALVSALLQDDTCAHALSGKKASEGLADVAELDPDVHCAWVAHRLKKMVDVGAVMLTERDARPVSDGAFVNRYATGLVASAHVEQGAASATTDASSDEEEEPEPQPQPIVFEPAAEMKRVTDMVRRFQKWNVVAPRGGEMLRLAVPSAASMTDEALTSVWNALISASAFALWSTGFLATIAISSFTHFSTSRLARRSMSSCTLAAACCALTSSRCALAAACCALAASRRIVAVTFLAACCCCLTIAGTFFATRSTTSVTSQCGQCHVPFGCVVIPTQS